MPVEGLSPRFRAALCCLIGAGGFAFIHLVAVYEHRLMFIMLMACGLCLTYGLTGLFVPQVFDDAAIARPGRTQTLAIGAAVVGVLLGLSVGYLLYGFLPFGLSR